MPTPILLSCQFSAAYGGVGHSLLDLARHLDRQQFRPIVLCTPEGGLPQMAARAQAQIHTVGAGQYWRYSLKHPFGTCLDITRVAREIVRLARSEGVRVVHAFDGMVFFAATLAQQYVKDLRVIWLDSGFNLYRYHFRLVMRWCFPRAARVTTTTQIRLRQLLAEGLQPAKAAVVPLGTDFHLRPLPAPSHKALRIGIIGRLVPIKNFELFLRAAQLVAARHAQVQFVIVGGQGLFPEEIAYYHNLLALVDELGLRERVLFHEPLENVAPLLNSFDVLACSSHLETFGRTLIEAMALRKPVVATAVGGIPEVVKDGETGLLVPPNDVTAFAARLNQLIADAELRATLGQRGYERVLQHFDVRMIARRWEQLYHEVLAAEPAARSLRGQAPQPA